MNIQSDSSVLLDSNMYKIKVEKKLGRTNEIYLDFLNNKIHEYYILYKYIIF